MLTLTQPFISAKQPIPQSVTLKNQSNMQLIADRLFARAFAHELETEATSTRKCLERFKWELSDYKPHEKSMAMGYLAQLVSEIPAWIMLMLNEGEIDFATYQHQQPKNTEELVAFFDKNVKEAVAALLTVNDGDLEKKSFYFKRDGQTLLQTTRRASMESTINHLVHHRGQLTVYMRLNDIDVPAIYGPSADDRTFGQLEK